MSYTVIVLSHALDESGHATTCVLHCCKCDIYGISRRLIYAQTLFMHPFIARVPVARPCLAGVI